MNKIDFKHTAFILVKPPSRIVSQHRLKNNSEYQELLNKAIEAGHCLYFAPMEKRQGRLVAIQPWELNPDTIPRPTQAEPVPEPVPTDQLCCPFCNKPMSSTSGRTLHVKSTHADKLEEYQKWLKSLGKKSKK